MAKNAKKIKILCEEDSVVWKESPPGPAQIELERMFKNNLIGFLETPNEVRSKNPLFLKHSSRNFAIHFRKTKAKLGLYGIKCDLSFDSFYLTKKKHFLAANKIEGSGNSIPELGQVSDSTILVSKHHNVSDDISEIELDNDPIQYVNAPYATWTYMDHGKKSNFVVVAIPIISGTTDINFSVSEDGLSVTMHFTWPAALFNASELFHDEIHHKDPAQKISPDHPKVHALSSHLLGIGVTENSQPKGKIVVNLPTKVVRDIEGWTKRAVKKPDGTKIVLLEFKAFQDKSIIKHLDTSISFD